MKIIIAPDSFKGSLTAQEAASAIEQGIKNILPDAEIVLIPMADGGEGTLEALILSTNGKFKEVEAVDPLGRPIKSRYGILPDNKTAVIEMAVVSGLLLLQNKERNPLFTTTYGTGQLIKDAIGTGYRELIVTVGGSSTNDCGTGMAQTLGVKFLKKDGTEITDKMSGGLLGEVNSIDMSKLEPAIKDSRITVACDVKNPLLGNNGCARVYSPQKGATPEIVEQLEKNMASFIEVAEKTIHQSVRDIPGAGAAGGLGAGLMLFLKAQLHSGIDIVMDACNFSERIKDADLIITGEGKIDEQTAFGKTIAGIATVAKKQNIPVIAFGGIVENADELYKLGIKNIEQICPKPMAIEKSMADASNLLRNTTEKVMKGYKKS